MKRSEALLLTGARSSGTLRLEDLLPVALDTLKEVDPSNPWMHEFERNQRQALRKLEREDDDADDAASTIYELIEDHINQELPTGFFYGASEGDPADIGIWATLDGIAPKIRNLLEMGGDELPAFAFPGGYPMYYIGEFGDAICPDCANEDLSDLVGYDTYLEGPPLVCGHCNAPIESAYGDPDVVDKER